MRYRLRGDLEPEKLIAMVKHLNRGTFILHARAGQMMAGDYLSQRAYRVPGFPDGVGRNEIPNLTEDQQRHIASFWFLSNFQRENSTGKQGVQFPYLPLEPFNSMSLEFRDSMSANAITGAGNDILRLAPDWIPIPELPDDDIEADPDLLVSEAAFRADVLRRLAYIQRELATLQDLHRHGPGGNNPPDDLPIDAAEEADRACADLAETLSDAVPDPHATKSNVVRLLASAETIGGWVLRTVGKVAERAIVVEGEKALTPEAIKLATYLYNHVISVIGFVSKWLTGFL